MNYYHPVTWHGACALPILPLEWPIYIAFVHHSAMDQARSIKFGSKYGYEDFYRISTFQVRNGRSLGSRDQLRNFVTPKNLWRKRAICLKFGRDIEDGSCLRMDRKATPKWAWLYYPFADRVHPLYVSTKLVKVRGPGGSAPWPPHFNHCSQSTLYFIRLIHRCHEHQSRWQH